MTMRIHNLGLLLLAYKYCHELEVASWYQPPQILACSQNESASQLKHRFQSGNSQRHDSGMDIFDFAGE